MSLQVVDPERDVTQTKTKNYRQKGRVSSDNLLTADIEGK